MIFHSDPQIVLFDFKWNRNWYIVYKLIQWRENDPNSMINTKHDPGTSIGSTARIGRTAHRVQYGLAPLHLLFDSKDVKEKKKEKKKSSSTLAQYV